jgi:pimeloyl-ACP methyl ester carboxylesterase
MTSDKLVIPTTRRRMTTMRQVLGDGLVRRALGLGLYPGHYLFWHRRISETPDDAGLAFRELDFATGGGDRLRGWWIAGRTPSLGHLLFCHGNDVNIGDRVLEADLLTQTGFDVLLFDYRGYGRSRGRQDEPGTYRDARAALAALRRQRGVDQDRVFYLGESLGGAVALELAVHRPPRGLILQSTFTSVRDMAQEWFPSINPELIPDAYPSTRLITRLTVPLLVLHGDRDKTVPYAHGKALKLTHFAVAYSLHVDPAFVLPLPILAGDRQDFVAISAALRHVLLARLV